MNEERAMILRMFKEDKITLEEADALLEALGEKEKEVVREEVGKEKTEEILFRAFSNITTPDVQVESLRMLEQMAGKLGPQRMGRILSNMLPQSPPNVQVEAIKMLERVSDRIGSEKVMELLSNMLEYANSPDVQAEALKVLTKMAK
jgi:hypothetical protein